MKKKESRQQRIRSALMDDILTGRLPPGKKLAEEELAARLGCSRTPIREAIRHLEGIGLVIVRPNCGAVVATLDRCAMLDLFDAMMEVEGACAELAARSLRRDIHEKLLALSNWAAPLADFDENETLLSILHQAVDNKILVEVAKTLQSRLLPYWRLLMTADSDWGRKGSIEQRAVIAAVLSGNGHAARVGIRALFKIARELV